MSIRSKLQIISSAALRLMHTAAVNFLICELLRKWDKCLIAFYISFNYAESEVVHNLAPTSR